VLLEFHYRTWKSHAYALHTFYWPCYLVVEYLRFGQRNLSLSQPLGQGFFWWGKDLQQLERQKRLNFLPEMQSKVTTNFDNASGHRTSC